MARRLPGQSIREEKERLLDDRFIPFYFSTAFAWMLWGWELYRTYTIRPVQPNALLCLAIVLTGVSVIVCGRLWKKFGRLNRGERGELAVAEVLDNLRGLGYGVFHDLRRDGFNIDHIVVGPGGVFAVETKFRRGHGEIEFRNGEGLFIGGLPDERESLTQARGSAKEVSQIIQDNCGRFEWVSSFCGQLES